MRNGYNIDTLTSVDNKEIIRFGGKFLQIYEEVLYRENYKVNRFKELWINYLN